MSVVSVWVKSELQPKFAHKDTFFAKTASRKTSFSKANNLKGRRSLPRLRNVDGPCWKLSKSKTKWWNKSSNLTKWKWALRRQLLLKSPNACSSSIKSSRQTSKPFKRWRVKSLVCSAKWPKSSGLRRVFGCLKMLTTRSSNKKNQTKLWSQDWPAPTTELSQRLTILKRKIWATS